MTRTPGGDPTMHPSPADREPPAQPPADPDAPCYHPTFDAVIAVGRIGEDDQDGEPGGMPRHFVAEVQIKCAACGERFKFEGVPAGMSFTAPATSLDGFELRAPIRPEQAAPAFPRRGEVTGFGIELHRRDQRRGPRGGRR